MEEHDRTVIGVGEQAPNFSLKDQHDRTFGLLEHMGQRMLLSFHPLAWTEYCAAQMVSLEENRDLLSSLNTLAVGISVDSVPCKREWAAQLRIANTRLLCDFWPHGRVAARYGLFRDANGFSERAHVILDAKQKVVWTRIYPIHSVPDIDEVIGVIKGLGT